MISVITPTIRKDGLEIVRNSLRNQNTNDWEWLIGSPFDPEYPEATWVKDDFEGGYWSLNRCYNALFRRCRGALIVSWQDWIHAPADGLEKFKLASEQYPNTVISGVGDQYMRLNKFGKPEVKIWSDPRKGDPNNPNTNKYGSFYECMWNDVEWNWCAFPKKLIEEIGGMDEQLDFLGYGGDQFQVSDRLNDYGTRFYIDQTNESFTIRHNRDAHGGQEKWDGNHVLFNGSYEKRKQELLSLAKWPKLDFLPKDH